MTLDDVNPQEPLAISQDETQSPKQQQGLDLDLDSWQKNFLELKEIVRLEQILHEQHLMDSNSSAITQKNNQSEACIEETSSSHRHHHHQEQDACYISLESLQVTNPKIAKWIYEQKSSAKKWEAGLISNMTQERLDLLHSISFFHIFQNKYDASWNEQFERLQKHYLETGNFYVKEHDLKRWMRKQKQEYDAFENINVGSAISNSDHTTIDSVSSCSSSMSNSESSYPTTMHMVKTTMTRERMDKLDSIHFSSYNPSTFTSDPKFENRLEELKQFKLQHGHLKVPKVCPSNKSLGRWVTRIRAQYRLYMEGKPHCGVITDSRIQQLDSIGFEWESTSKFTANVTWDRRFQELVEYQKEHQSTNVPGKYKENRALAAWVRNQRYQYWAKKRGKKSPMTTERIEKLDSIGFRW